MNGPAEQTAEDGSIRITQEADIASRRRRLDNDVEYLQFDRRASRRCVQAGVES